MTDPNTPDDPARVGPPDDEHCTDPIDVPDSEWEWKDCPTAKDFEGLWESGEGEV